MDVIWTEQEIYSRIDFETEADFESAIRLVRKELFGANRVYLEVKRRIGTRGGIQNVPDGYLLDLNGSKPRLYVVENELKSHDPLRHIAVQVLQFSLYFGSDPLAIKRILLNALQADAEAKAQAENFVIASSFRNLDDMLEYLVEAPFAALVIIDEMPEQLETILSERFTFAVEVLELSGYENASGKRLYRFEPFLADVTVDAAAPSSEQGSARTLATDEIDTIVVPAREDGFQQVFLGENRWYQVRIHGSMRPQIRYVAVYQVAPVSAITYVAPVKSIERWKDTEKFVLNFSEPAHAIGPVPLVRGGRVTALQNLRYTSYKRLCSAKSLDDIWATEDDAVAATSSSA